MKGLVQVAEHPDQPLLLHAVQQILHPPVVLDAWPDADRRSRLVLIVKDIEETVVQRLWAGLPRPGRAKRRPRGCHRLKTRCLAPFLKPAFRSLDA